MAPKLGVAAGRVSARTGGPLSGHARQEEAFADAGTLDWSGWWESISEEPSVKRLLLKREARFEGRALDEETPVEALHAAALYNAGFSEVAPIWQWGNNRVLMAVR